MLYIILIVFYAVGVFGLSSSYRDAFLSLSFFNLLLTFILLLLGRKSRFAGFSGFLVLAFVVGFSVELIGTKTGLLFGSYAYGSNLGYRFWGVPLIIGLNWGILAVSAASVVHFLPGPSWLKAILSTGLMTGLDFLIEPVAMQSDYWNWENGLIPWYNYLCWFVIGWLLEFLYFRWKLAERNAFHATIFLVMSLFFVIVNLL